MTHHILSTNPDILQQYVKDVLKTAASDVHIVEIHKRLFSSAKTQFIQIAEVLDQIKKNVFYGKPYDVDKLINNMEALDAAQENLRAAVSYLNVTPKTAIKIDPDVFHGMLGIATESGELLELLHPYVEQNKIADEIGDINWYIGVLINAFKLNWATIQKANIAKLKARYPDKFDSDRAINRDIINEKKVLDEILDEIQPANA
ncbi:MAG: hypothetical protein ACREAU_01695 [Nitrosopumilaceae archaeon]